MAFVIKEVGSLNYLLPLLRLFDNLSENIILCEGECVSFVKDQKLNLKIYEINDVSSEKTEGLFLNNKIEKVVTGTSRTESIDKYAVIASRNLGIPCLSVVDHWSSFKERFSRLNECQIEELFCYLPDKIVVIDETAKEIALQEGIPHGKLIIGGHPGLEKIRERWTAKDIKKEVMEWRRINALDSNRIVTFVSEPYSINFKKSSMLSRGFDEYDVISDLINVILKLPGLNALLLKIHPNEEKGKFSDLVVDRNIRFYEFREEPPSFIVGLSDIIVGMGSMLLVEASLCGKKVISHQPGRGESDTFIGNKFGLTEASYSERDLEILLRSQLAKGPELYENQFAGSCNLLYEIILELD